MPGMKRYCVIALLSYFEKVFGVRILVLSEYQSLQHQGNQELETQESGT